MVPALERMLEARIKYLIIDRRKRVWAERHGEPYTGPSRTVFELYEQALRREGVDDRV